MARAHLLLVLGALAAHVASASPASAGAADEPVADDAGDGGATDSEEAGDFVWHERPRAAQDEPAATRDVRAPLSPVRFATLDTFDRTSAFGAQYSAADLPGVGVDASRLGVDARVMFGRYGGYAAFGIGEVVREGGRFSAAEGGLDVGGLWWVPLGRFDAIVRGGVLVSLGGADQTGLETNLAIASERLTDFAVMMPDELGFRASASLFATRGHLFGRVDVGSDLVIDGESETPGFPASGTQLLARLNLGGGVSVANAAFLVELASLHFTTSDLIDDKLRHTASAGARYRIGVFELGASVVKQLDFPDSAPYIAVATVELGLQRK